MGCTYGWYDVTHVAIVFLTYPFGSHIWQTTGKTLVANSCIRKALCQGFYQTVWSRPLNFLAYRMVYLETCLCVFRSEYLGIVGKLMTTWCVYINFHQIGYNLKTIF